MSTATCSTRASSTAAAAVRYAARRAIGSAAQPANAASAAATAAVGVGLARRGELATVSPGRIGFTFVYVSPEAAGTQSPPT